MNILILERAFVLRLLALYMEDLVLDNRRHVT